MVDDEKKGTSIFDDLESMFSSGKEILDSVKGAVTSHREDGTLTQEPIASDLALQLRALMETIEEEEREGMMHWQISRRRIRIFIGEGSTLRVYEGANVVEAVSMACAHELKE